MTGDQIESAARDWLGTPYQHQQRMKGVAVDCIGLVIGVARELKLVPELFDFTGYTMEPNGITLIDELSKKLTKVGQRQMMAGDVLCVAGMGSPRHVGIIGKYRHGGHSIIHAASNPGRVIETRLLFGPVFRYVQAFRFPEVEWRV